MRREGGKGRTALLEDLADLGHGDGARAVLVEHVERLAELLDLLGGEARHGEEE